MRFPRFLRPLLFAFLLPLSLGAQKLSGSAEISLMTCAPGTDLYSVFGHCAMYISDPVIGIDKIYNYGTFSFNEPGFYVKFARGKLNYLLSTESFQSFMRQYQYEKREVKQQVLALTPNEKQAVFEYLEKNALPENRRYLYDFFFDNCASRLRDVLEDVLGDKLQFDYNFVEEAGKKSFRQLIDPYLENMEWADFGIDLGLGSVTDKTAPGRDYMFLPDYLYQAFADASIVRNGKSSPLVKNEITVYSPPSPAEVEGTPFYLHPVFVCWMIFAVLGLLTFLEVRNRWRLIALDFALLVIYGFLGWFVLLLWVATDHTATAGNLNVLWLAPTHLIVAFFLVRRKKASWLDKYFALSGVILIILLMGWIFIPQQFHIAYLPLMLIMMIRMALLPGKLKSVKSDSK